MTANDTFVVCAHCFVYLRARAHQEHTKGIPRVHQGHTKSTPRGYQGHTKGVLRAHQGHTKGVLRAHQGHTKGVLRAHQGHTKGVSGNTFGFYTLFEALRYWNFRFPESGNYHGTDTF